MGNLWGFAEVVLFVVVVEIEVGFGFEFEDEARKEVAFSVAEGVMVEAFSVIEGVAVVAFSVAVLGFEFELEAKKEEASFVPPFFASKRQSWTTLFLREQGHRR